MPGIFWVKRFVLAFVVAAGLLFAARLWRGFAAQPAAEFALLWALVSASVFTAVGYLRFRRKPSCMLPKSR